MKPVEIPIPQIQLKEQREQWLQWRTIEGWICSHRRDVPLELQEIHLPFGARRWRIVGSWDAEVTESEFSRVEREIDAYEKAKRGLA